MLNACRLIGFVGADPKSTQTKDGREVVTFSLATSERWRDKDTGDRREATEWHPVVVFNEALAKLARDYVRKGSKVYVEGPVKRRKFTDRDGRERETAEIVLQAFRGTIVLLDGKREDGGGQSSTDHRPTIDEPSATGQRYGDHRGGAPARPGLGDPPNYRPPAPADREFALAGGGARTGSRYAADNRPERGAKATAPEPAGGDYYNDDIPF
jgi:single-strand DNA-binding protein